MTSFLKEMENIIEENKKLREENKKYEQLIISQKNEIIDIKKKYRDIEEKHKTEIKKQKKEFEEALDEAEEWLSNASEGAVCDCLEFIMGDRGLINDVFSLLHCYYNVNGSYSVSKSDEDLWESLGGFETIIEENEKLKDLKKNNSDWARIRGEDISKVYSNYSRVRNENEKLRRKLEERYKDQLQPEIEILSNQSELIKFPYILRKDLAFRGILGWSLYSQCELRAWQTEQKNIELRVQLNEKNREISEILMSLDKYKQDKISRGQKIGSLISINKELYNNLGQITIEKDKLKIEKDKLKESFDQYHKQSNENQKMMQTQLSKYNMGINQQNQIKKWFDENCDNLNYRQGKKLYDIIN